MSAPLLETRKCALCGKPQDAGFRPFCSKRCADLDLGKWLNEGYAIPGGEAPEAHSDLDKGED
jgi:hypothetical protein